MPPWPSGEEAVLQNAPTRPATPAGRPTLSRLVPPGSPPALGPCPFGAGWSPILCIDAGEPVDLELFGRRHLGAARRRAMGTHAFVERSHWAGKLDLGARQRRHDAMHAPMTSIADGGGHFVQ